MNRTVIPGNTFLQVAAFVTVSVVLICCNNKTPDLKKQQEKPDSVSITGKASFYANMLQWCTTSSGDDYDANDFTCAHRTLPFNTILSITNTANGKTAIVRVNDRGPYIKGRMIDLSRAAAKKLGMLPDGVIQIKMMELPPLNSFLQADSLLHNGEVLDTHGNRQQLGKHPVYIWSTQSFKHAVYMATSVQNEHRINAVYIKVSVDNTGRHYKLYIPDEYAKKDTDMLITALKQDGFFLCRHEKK